MVVVDEGGNGSFEFARDEIVLQKDTARQDSMPPLGLFLSLGNARRTTYGCAKARGQGVPTGFAFAGRGKITFCDLTAWQI